MSRANKNKNLFAIGFAELEEVQATAAEKAAEAAVKAAKHDKKVQKSTVKSDLRSLAFGGGGTGGKAGGKKKGGQTPAGASPAATAPIPSTNTIVEDSDAVETAKPTVRSGERHQQGSKFRVL